MSVRIKTLAVALVALGSACSGLLADERKTQRITWWHFWPQEIIKPLIEEFEAEHPGLKVESQQLTWAGGFDKIVVSFAHHLGPDVVELGSTDVAPFVEGGWLVDITDEVSDLRGKYLAWEPGTYDGRVYACPWLLGTRALFFNRDLFLRAGLDPEKPPETWQELLDAARRIDNLPGGTFRGYGMDFGERDIPWKKFLPFVWGNGGAIFSENLDRVLFDSPETRQALDFYLQLSDYSLLEKQAILETEFRRGRLGMLVTGSWLVGEIRKDSPELSFGTALVPRPALDRGTHASFYGGEYLAVSAETRSRKEALALMRFLLRKESAIAICRKKLAVMPASHEALKDPFYQEDPALAAFALQMKTAVSPPNHPRWALVRDILDGMLEKTLYRKSTPGEALSEAARALEKLTLDKRPRPHSDLARRLPMFALLGLLASTACLLALACRRQKSNFSLGTLLLLSPWLISFGVFWAFPIFYSALVSLFDYPLLRPGECSWVGFGNFTELLRDSLFWKALANTSVFAIGSVALTTSLSLALALLVDQARFLRKFVRTSFFIPSVTSVVVLSLLFKFWAPKGWLTSETLALPWVMVMSIFRYVGYYMIFFLVGLQAIPDELYESAAMDGASAFAKFRFITLPLLKPITFFVLVIATIRSVQMFPEAFVMTKGGPLHSTFTLVYFLYERAFHDFRFGYSSAAAWLLFLVILLAVILYARALGKELNVGG